MPQTRVGLLRLVGTEASKLTECWDTAVTWLLEIGVNAKNPLLLSANCTIANHYRTTLGGRSRDAFKKDGEKDR